MKYKKITVGKKARDTKRGRGYDKEFLICGFSQQEGEMVRD